jgi:tRNA A-37 threonylcarbamoyl transferase component Bud32
LAIEVSKTRKYKIEADIYNLGVIIPELFNFDPDERVIKINSFFD